MQVRLSRAESPSTSVYCPMSVLVNLETTLSAAFTTAIYPSVDLLLLPCKQTAHLLGV